MNVTNGGKSTYSSYSAEPIIYKCVLLDHGSKPYLGLTMGTRILIIWRFRTVLHTQYRALIAILDS